ncbi:MAG: ribosomal RNA small subunit methyltransferase A [Clostridiales bacterium]|nr:ribosomal RNA small subunit methyltransferase A [Clostridiales bacterium]
MEEKVSEVLKQTGFAFKKQFGQNFITDKNLLADIVEKSGVNKSLTVVEIGCGAGTLTRAIAERAKRVIAFEIDTKLKPVLEKTLAGVDNAEVVFKDFTKVRMDLFEEELGEDYAVVANLPYYITTPLIMQFIEHSKRCVSLSVMVQEEVAKRLCAEPNTPDYGAITAVIALRGKGKIIKSVPRKMFYPVPNVDSAVVQINLTQGGVDVEDCELYKKSVHAAFLSRRKTLENNLVNAFKLSREQAKGVLNECLIDEKARGETLSPVQFASLAKALSKYIK